MSAIKNAELTGNLGEALQMCDELLERSESHDYASTTRVRLLIKLERLSEARRALDETEKRFPENLQNDVLGARLAEKAGDVTEALARWDAVLARSPAHDEANQGRVRALLMQGQVTAARTHARSLPKCAVGQIALARGLHDIGQSMNALDVLDDVLADDPQQIDALLWKARILVRFSRLGEARQLVWQLGSDNVDGLVILARVSERLGDFQTARQSWVAVLDARPGHREAMLSLDVLDLKNRLQWSTHCLDLSQDRDRVTVGRVRSSILHSKLGAQSWWNDAYANDPPAEHREHFDHLESYVERHSYMRYNRAAFTMVPWLASSIDLANSTVVEVGCGTGSTTAVLASNCKHVFGYDIDAQVLATAEVRLDALNIGNASVFCHDPSAIQHAILQRHGTGTVDVVILYAVVEHQTLDERMEALANSWSLLRPGGCLAVIEAPNRLTYYDWHSSQLPFFHMLPRELQAKYVSRSPRSEFASSIAQSLERGGHSAADEALIRFGQSVSYHDFELVFGQLDHLIIADGFHHLIERDKPAREKKGEGALAGYIEDEGLTIPKAFRRANIDVVLQKPAP